MDWLARLAVRPHLQSDRLPQSADRHGPMGVVVLQLPASHPPDHGETTRRIAWRVVYAGAAAGAIAPMPASLVERWYSLGIYPILQRALTSVSDLVPFAI